jgi:copper(I)-binding protein
MNADQFLLGLVLASSASVSIAAQPVKPPTCRATIANAWVRAAPPQSDMLAGYATIRNPCATALTIVGAESPQFHDVSLHQTINTDEMSHMRMTTRVTVPAHGEVRMTPGAMHLMLMRPVHDFQPGEKVRLTMRFANGGQLATEFPVLREAPAK